MAKSIKLKDNTYWSDSGVTHNREPVKDFLTKRLEAYNDTSGSDTNEMLRNKIAVVETQLANVNHGMMFLNGGWSGVNYAMSIGSKIGSAISVMSIFDNGIHIGRKYGGNYSYMHIPRDNVSYSMTGTTGWKRIAYLDGMAGGVISISNNASDGTMGQITFASSSGWNTHIIKNYKIYTNNQLFTKARLVYKGNDRCYLEIYQNIAESRTLDLHLSGAINVTLYASPTGGSVPSGYSTTEIAF